MRANDAVSPRDARRGIRAALIAAIYFAALGAGPCGPTDAGGSKGTSYKATFSVQWTFSNRTNINLVIKGCDYAMSDTGTVTITLQDGGGSWTRTGSEINTSVAPVNGANCNGLLAAHSTAGGGSVSVSGSSVTYTDSPAPETSGGLTTGYTANFNGVLSGGVITGTLTSISSGSGTVTGGTVTNGGTYSVSLSLR